MQSLLIKTTGRAVPQQLRSSRRRFCHAFVVASTLSWSNDFVSGYTFQRLHHPDGLRRPFHPGRRLRVDPHRQAGYQHFSNRPTTRHGSTPNGDSLDSSPSGGSSTHHLSPPPSPAHQRTDPRREAILARNPEPDDAPILAATLDWVQNVVIGLNFCPFADKPFQSNRLFMEVIPGQDESEIMARVLGECLVRKDQPGTSLMICPDLYPTNFETFLQVYNMLNEGVLAEYHNQNGGDDEEEDDLTNHVQIAPFHPLFEFDGSGRNGVDNYTNRSPYPIFHILREDEVGHAVDLLDGDASRVWKRNVELLEALGEEFDDDTLKEIMSGKMTADTTTGCAVRDKVKEIYKALKRKTTDI